jgi:class 3 adenylate cyclase
LLKSAVIWSAPRFDRHAERRSAVAAPAEPGSVVVTAALAIQRALAELNRKNEGTGKPALAARIAIDSGSVVVDATGETIRVRVQRAAKAAAGP